MVHPFVYLIDTIRTCGHLPPNIDSMNDRTTDGKLETRWKAKVDEWGRQLRWKAIASGKWRGTRSLEEYKKQEHMNKIQNEFVEKLAFYKPYVVSFLHRFETEKKTTAT